MTYTMFAVKKPTFPMGHQPGKDKVGRCAMHVLWGRLHEEAGQGPLRREDGAKSCAERFLPRPSKETWPEGEVAGWGCWREVEGWGEQALGHPHASGSGTVFRFSGA